MVTAIHYDRHVIACTAGPWRALRAGTLGLTIGALSVVGHGAGQAHAVSGPAVIAVLGAAVLGAIALTARRLSLVPVLGFAVVLQLVSHFLLTRLGAHAATTHSAMPHQHARYPTLPNASATPLDVDWAMIGAHAVAALLVAFVVLRAEDALFGFAGAVGRTARVLFGGLVAALGTTLVTPRAVVDRTPVVLIPQWVSTYRLGRGPPVLQRA